MAFIPKQFVKAKAAEKAKRRFGEMDREGELADDELDNVSGGWGSPRPAGQIMALAEDGSVVCPQCHGGLNYGWTHYDGDGSYIRFRAAAAI